MRKIIKYRWVLFVVWIAALGLSLIYSPDLNKVLRAKGTQYLSSDNASMKAQKVLDEMDKTPGSSNLVVFHSSKKITSDELKDIETGVKNIRDNGSSVGVSDILDPFSKPDIKSKLISSDGKTLMVTFKMDKKGREVKNIKDSLNKMLKDVHVDHYFTGSDFISDDYLRAVSAGVDKSAVLTVLFILVVLIIMFRSVVTPIVSLLGVAISYLISYAIVGQCVYRFDYPISPLTQIVLVLILFGIGTDYNILLFNRFKEEMGKQASIDDAIVTTYKTAGKTVAFSISTVFIAFLSLTLAKFGLYRSANCVAIAVVVLLLEIMTFTPVLLRVLGPKLFWPSKKVGGHKQSKFWAKATNASVKNPIVFAALVFIFIIGVSCFTNEKYSYDNLKELGSSYDSVKGFNIVSDSFGKGQALTTTIAIKNDKAMDNKESLEAIDDITNRLKSVKGVKSVSSVTQPLSNPIDSLYISNQTKTVVDGLFAAKNGVDKINDGVNQIKGKLDSTDMSGLSKVNQLVDGTTQVENGMNLVYSGMQQVNAGIAQGANGANQISQGVSKAQAGLNTIITYTGQLSDGLDKLQAGYTQLGKAYDDGILSGIEQAQTGIHDLNNSLKDNSKGLGKNVYDLKQASDTLNSLSSQGTFDKIAEADPYFKNALRVDPALVGTLKGIQKCSTGLSEGINGFNEQINEQLPVIVTKVDELDAGAQEYKGKYDFLTSNLTTASGSLKKINSAQVELSQGLSQLKSGSDALNQGLNKAGTGQGQLVDNMPKLTSGLDQVRNGQKTLNDSLTKLASSVPTLKTALNQSSDGLTKISSGLTEANDYLKQLNDSDTFFMPDEGLKNSSMKESMDSYMTDDRKITKITVVLDSDPYSLEAMDIAKNIDNAAKSSIKNTTLKNAYVGTAGASATDYDLNTVAKNDLDTMKVIVLVSIFIVLLFIIRSPLISLYITVSLAGAYCISAFGLNFIVMHIFKYEGISWNVPFFSFAMIVALGVDYSIFLMMRFKEYKNLDNNHAIIEASKNIGGIVMSAALILGGTFVTMVPAGIRLLTQLAIAVVIGLIALALLLLPVFLPSLIALPGAIKNIGSKKENKKEDKIA